MKKNPVTLIAGGCLILLFTLLLFCFQVRQGEVAVVTTFGRPTRTYEPGGPYFKWPTPIQKDHHFDQRIQNYEGKFEETLTSDAYPLLMMTYLGWRISDPAQFFPRFAGGQIAKAEENLESLVRDAKNAVVGQHPFAHFISTDQTELKLTQIESEILRRIQTQAKANNYGIEIKFVGIKRLGLPDSVTEAVFSQMQSERQVKTSSIENEGTAQASRIRSDATTISARLLTEADTEASRILGLGELEAAKSFAVFEQNPELASLLLKLSALEASLKEKTTLILDQRTPPLDLLQLQPGKK